MALSLVPEGGAVVAFLNFLTMAPAVAIILHEFHIDGSRRVYSGKGGLVESKFGRVLR